MQTAIQLRNDRSIKCSLLYGHPDGRKQGSLGEIVLFDASNIVVYCIAAGKKKTAFVFKTDPCGSATVPGVAPAVNLLCEAKSKGKVTRLLRVLGALGRQNISLSELPEGFFIRLNVILNDHHFSISNVMGLLSHAKL